MKTLEVPVKIDNDADAVIEHFLTGKPLDSDIARRIDERADAITESLRRKYGTLDVAVSLVREVRDEE